jgi:hypothetical protein
MQNDEAIEIQWNIINQAVHTQGEQVEQLQTAVASLQATVAQSKVVTGRPPPRAATRRSPFRNLSNDDATQRFTEGTAPDSL